MTQRVQSRRVRLTTGGQPDEVGSVAVQRGGSTCFPGRAPRRRTTKHNQAQSSHPTYPIDLDPDTILSDSRAFSWVSRHIKRPPWKCDRFSSSCEANYEANQCHLRCVAAFWTDFLPVSRRELSSHLSRKTPGTLKSLPNAIHANWRLTVQRQMGPV